MNNSVDKFFKKLLEEDKELAALVKIEEDKLEEELQNRLLTDKEFRDLYEREHGKINND